MVLVVLFVPSIFYFWVIYSLLSFYIIAITLMPPLSNYHFSCPTELS